MNRTDIEWEKWGAKDPYYGVMTAERFRTRQLTPEARSEFFALGEDHVRGLYASCHQYFGPDFAPQSALDFGCGVGRVLIPLARRVQHVVGVDVSPSMLAEARRNCDEQGLERVHLLPSDDELSQVHDQFDLVHSALVLQHIEVPRGRRLFHRLLQCVRPGGFAVIQVTYGKTYHPETLGQPPAALPDPPSPSSRTGAWARVLRSLVASPALEASTPQAPVTAVASSPPSLVGDPEMHMHAYNLSELAYLLQAAGAVRWHGEFGDHGGELGVMIYAALTGRPR